MKYQNERCHILSIRPTVKIDKHITGIFEKFQHSISFNLSFKFL